MSIEKYREGIRNIVIIAHVDHGKTTLVDCLLRQSGQFRDSQLTGERILDSNDLERERGITILAKNIALPYRDLKINIIDTPGHADFGGEVERVLRMADGALLLVDAAEGPMPQTRFVLSKALEVGLKPIVVVNKVDRPDQRAIEVLDEALELIVELGGEKYLDDFQYIFASARDGFATPSPEMPSDSMKPLLEMVYNHVPPPKIVDGQDFQMQVTTLDWSEYVGRIAIGRIVSGQIQPGDQVIIHQQDDRRKRGKVVNVMLFDKLGRIEVESASAGDVVALVGLEEIEIGDTIAGSENVPPLPRIEVDRPTLEMIFTVNSSPLAGRDGKFVTGRQLRERLARELERNVALRVRNAEGSDAFVVSGRGVLHLAVLIETMRREGFELSVGKPQVVKEKIDNEWHEPFEILHVEAPPEQFGSVMELVGARRGELIEMGNRGDYTFARFSIPARGLIGLRTKLLNSTQGTVVMHHRFETFKKIEGEIPRRPNGVLVSNVAGKAVPYALFNLQARAEMMVAPGDDVYEGMVVGENSRDNDLPVNPCREKKLTNVRASGSDENILLKPAKKLGLEAALEWVEDDELVEITPQNIRIRKALLKESDRKRLSRAALAAQ
ncbi:MAG TPA: translational GTPase TypA [Pirellulaceae bacterium]|nr:translational GTPase TypA [Pirellulaceae bacterium]